MLTSQFACRSNLQRRDETDRGRNLVRVETLVADMKDLALTLEVRLSFQDYVRDDQRTSNGASPRPNDRHSHGRVAVDDGLDFFGVDLQPTDIDDSALSTKEVVAVTASLHDVAGVDKALTVDEGRVFLAEIADRSPRGTDPERTVLDLHFHLATRADQAHRESLETVIDLESDTCFRRGISMADGSLRVE